MNAPNVCIATETESVEGKDMYASRLRYGMVHTEPSQTTHHPVVIHPKCLAAVDSLSTTVSIGGKNVPNLNY